MPYQNLIGFILPPVIDFVNTRVQNAKARYWVAMAISFTIGILVNFGKLNNPQELLGNAAIVFAAAQTTYYTYWAKSGIREVVLKRIK